MATFLLLEKHCGYPLIALNFFCIRFCDHSSTSGQPGNLSPNTFGTTEADCNHSQTDWQRSVCCLIYKCRQTANMLKSICTDEQNSSAIYVVVGNWLNSSFIPRFKKDCWVPLLFWNNYVTVCIEISEFLFLISCNLSYKFWFHVNLHPIMQMTPFNHKMMSHWLGLNAVFFFAVLMYQSCFEDSDWLWVTADHVPVFEATN